MSNSDVKKGIAIQAKADAEKIEKLAKGLNAHRSVLASLESGQTEIRDAIGIVLDDMSAGEAKYLYDLQVKKTPDELDHTEKRVLCACIYTLLSSYGQDSPRQTEFYTNLEKYLGVSERKQDFDFYSLNNVDSHTDRLVILKTICSFLFLNQETFSFLREKDTFSWLFAFAPVKDVGDICSAINAEYAVLGANGILGNYDPVLAPHKTMEDRFYAITSGEEEIKEIEEEPAPVIDYKELTDTIVEWVADESAFGKGTAFSEKEFKKELSRKLSDVAFDALVAASKIEKGYLFFTTYALYLKAGNIFNNEYVCLPYKSVQVSKMTTVEGKQPGTRKLLIPVLVDQDLKTYSVDDAKLQEEKLRDLLIHIADLKCDIAETDRILPLKTLSRKPKELLLSAIIYLLKKENLPLVDTLFLSKEWNLDSLWNDMAVSCNSDESYAQLAEEFIRSIPYPSKRVTALETMSLLMALVTNANKLAGREATSLSLSTEKGILSFSAKEVDKKEFNLMVNQSVGKLKDKPYKEYIAVRDELSERELILSELITPFLDSIIVTIESGLDFKAKAAMKKTAKDVSQLAVTVQDKVKENVEEMTKRAKRGKKKSKAFSTIETAKENENEEEIGLLDSEDTSDPQG